MSAFSVALVGVSRPDVRAMDKVLRIGRESPVVQDARLWLHLLSFFGTQLSRF